MTLETYRGEENVSFSIVWRNERLKRGEGAETSFLPQTQPFRVLTLCSPPPSSLVSHLISECVLLVCSLPGHQKEDAADSQVGQEHEEPDSRGEGIQEGEVTRPASLKHTGRHKHTHKGLKSLLPAQTATL